MTRFRGAYSKVLQMQGSWMVLATVTMSTGLLSHCLQVVKIHLGCS